jgi:tetratricopeptide (TPR) repeat protein
LLAQVELLVDDKLWNGVSRKVRDWCQKHPDDMSTPVSICRTLSDDEDSEAKKTAEDLLRGILEREPNSLPAMNMLATLLQTTGRSEESAKLYQRVVESQPDNVIAINNLAWIMCEEQGKYQQALQLAHRGLEKAPNYVDLIDTLGVVYFRLGEFDKAVQELRRSVKLYPAHVPSIVTSYLHLGKALAKLGHKAEAIENLKKSRELNSKMGGLSAADAAETQRLIEQLSRGS